jgi:hypothetical protein
VPELPTHLDCSLLQRGRPALRLQLIVSTLRYGKWEVPCCKANDGASFSSSDVGEP